MPISVALPAPSFSFDTEYIFTVPRRTDSAGGGAGVTDGNRVIARPGWEGDTEAGDNLGNLIAAGASTQQLQLVGGKVAAAISPAAAANEGYYMPLPVWQPAVGDGTGQAVGSKLSPPWVVAIIDVHLAMSAAAVPGAPTADRLGVFFIPDGGNLNPWGPPGGGVSAAAGGFGIMVNDDGGGTYQYEFVSADAVPNILQRTVLPVPDVTAWSTFRFTIRSAVPGVAATLSLEVNGSTVAAVQALPFDDVTLFKPETLQPQASTWAWGWFAHDLGAEFIATTIYGRFGRFAPDGQEVQTLT